jgi:ABC-type multidrug transport system fused ATPase/permease subunit
VKPLEGSRKFARSVCAIVGLAFAAAPRQASMAITAELLGAVLSLISSYQIQSVVQAASSRNPAHAVTSSLILAATGGAAAIAYIFYARLAPRVVEAITVHLDGELVRLTARIPTLDHAEQPLYADKISLIRNSSQQLASGLQLVALNLRILIMLVGTFVILIGIDPWLILLPVFAIPRVFAGQQARRLTVRAEEANAEPMRQLAHIFSQMISPAAGKELRIFGLGPELAERYRGITQRTRSVNIRMNWVGAFWLAIGDMAFTLSCVGAISWLVMRTASATVSPGSVALAATLVAGMTLQMAVAQQVAQYLQAILTTAERYLWLVEFSNEAVGVAAVREAPPKRLKRGIRLENVCFAYPGCSKPVLSDIFLELPAAKVIALVGENGSGKSTLVKLLCGFYPPSAGRILLDDIDLEQVRLADWHGRISGAFQDFTNFEVVLHECVGVGQLARLGDRDLAASALDRAGGTDIANLGGAGLDAMLGRRWGGMELSGGQWQKLALGRALVREEPLLVVFDEPAAALDAGSEHSMFERFAAEARSGEAARRATLLISHRFSTVRTADAIAVLDGGRVAEFGSHQMLIAAGGKYAELFELQASAYR